MRRRDDDTVMRKVCALHARAASLQTDLGTTLSAVATGALLEGLHGERGALLAAVNMDLRDWQRKVDDGIRKRVLSRAVTRVTAAKTPSIPSAAKHASSIPPGIETGRKPYGDGFADLLRFVRNAYEHPPVDKEVEPLVATLLDVEKKQSQNQSVGLPAGWVLNTPHRKMTRQQRRALLAAYVLQQFPSLPLAVYECTLATD